MGMREFSKAEAEVKASRVDSVCVDNSKPEYLDLPL
jgi:hypothetical protein